MKIFDFKNSSVRLSPAHVLFMLSVMAGCAVAAPKDHPSCHLAAPPATAGELSHHQVKILVYPRAKDMGASFTGCQSLWASDEKATVLGWRFEFENGKAVGSYTAANKDEPAQVCRFRNGALVEGNPRHCDPEKDIEFMRSSAPGCFAKWQQARRDKLPRPKECEAEE